MKAIKTILLIIFTTLMTHLAPAQDFKVPDVDGRGKTVILTFDDASQSHYSVIPQMLKPYHFGATFYVCEFPPDFADTTKYMNWRQIKALSKMGYEIGNHTRFHSNVAELKPQELEAELSYMENKCQELGIPKPSNFAYPAYFTDSAAVPVLKHHGYLTARIGGDKAWQPGEDDPYYIPSFGISGNVPHVFYGALEQARKDNVILFCIHGVPDNAHDWVNTEPALFRSYLRYLNDHHFKVVSMQTYLKSAGKRMKHPLKNQPKNSGNSFDVIYPLKIRQAHQTRRQ
ncbi:MAG: polysaccharide deacetylase family protein [Mucilaginibacter sp.]|nr:polysaccharide deacetylase family protein [Mucilaginibacter sp.]